MSSRPYSWRGRTATLQLTPRTAIPEARHPDPLNELSADEAFERTEHDCGKGHPRREMAETARDPDDPWTRQFACPSCGFSFWETIELDGATAVTRHRHD